MLSNLVMEGRALLKNLVVWHLYSRKGLGFRELDLRLGLEENISECLGFRTHFLAKFKLILSLRVSIWSILASLRAFW